MEFQLCGCWLGAMWSWPAMGNVLTPWEPAALRPASSAAGLTGGFWACGASRPANTITATRATSETTATPVQSRVRWRRRFSSSRRAAAPLASLPLSGWRGLVLAGLRVSAIGALRILREGGTRRF